MAISPSKTIVRESSDAVVHAIHHRSLGPSESSTPQNISPPLLPAFLITGLLLVVIVVIIAWRHLVERQRMAQGRAEDPTWPEEGVALSQTIPTLWEVEVLEASGCIWEKAMPVSVAPLRVQSTKPRQPRYLIPSDRPVSFWTRVFGLRYRLEPQRTLPNISTTAPTNSRMQVICTLSDDEEPIDRLQVAVLVAFPRKRRKPQKQQGPTPVGESREASPTTEEPGSDPYSSDEDDSLQVSLGTIALPYSGDV